MADENLKALKSKLDLLESRIRDLLKSTEEELKLARAVQAILMPNRLPKFNGLECYAKYISSRELSSEFYDLIPSDNNRILWIFQSWTSNFGLATLITQTFMTLQSQKILAANSKGDLESVYEQLLETFKILDDAQSGNLRLMIRRLDMSRLSMDSIGFGFPPPILRAQDRNLWQNFQIEALEHYIKRPDLMKPIAFSKIAGLKPRDLRYSVQLKPGTRFFLCGASWNPVDNIAEFFRALRLDSTQFESEEASAVPKVDSKLLDDLNFLVVETQRSMKERGLKADVCIASFETDKKLLHLA